MKVIEPSQAFATDRYDRNGHFGYQFLKRVQGKNRRYHQRIFRIWMHFDRLEKFGADPLALREEVKATIRTQAWARELEQIGCRYLSPQWSDALLLAGLRFGGVATTTEDLHRLTGMPLREVYARLLRLFCNGKVKRRKLSAGRRAPFVYGLAQPEIFRPQQFALKEAA